MTGDLPFFPLLLLSNPLFIFFKFFLVMFPAARSMFSGALPPHHLSTKFLLTFGRQGTWDRAPGAQVALSRGARANLLFNRGVLRRHGALMTPKTVSQGRSKKKDTRDGVTMLLSEKMTPKKVSQDS